jgi:hypothetical protein
VLIPKVRNSRWRLPNRMYLYHSFYTRQQRNSDGFAYNLMTPCHWNILRHIVTMCSVALPQNSRWRQAKPEVLTYKIRKRTNTHRKLTCIKAYTVITLLSKKMTSKLGLAADRCIKTRSVTTRRITSLQESIDFVVI